ncbi:MAG TPA: hypothetical protein PKA00_08500 [Saprospiraceae bacterium]|nr:hypothetical protein [Saprospiraceae bacterium]HMQ82934.1 hypothetical protein [Saprospiraceae bacterium]
MTNHAPKWLSLALVLSLAFGCGRAYRGHNAWVPPCERYQIGTICFHNSTNKSLKVEIGPAETAIQSETTICLDLHAGQHEYKAKQGWHRWRDEVQVNSCSSSYVRLCR